MGAGHLTSDCCSRGEHRGSRAALAVTTLAAQQNRETLDRAKEEIMHREWCLLLAVWTAGCAGPDSQVVSHSEEGPVIDAHLHAFTMGWASSIASVDSTWWPKDIPHPTDSDSLREQTIRALAEAGVVRAVASGDDLRTVGRYAARAAGLHALLVRRDQEGSVGDTPTIPSLELLSQLLGLRRAASGQASEQPGT